MFLLFSHIWLMSLDIILFSVCQNFYSVFLFWSLGEIHVQIPAFLFPLACTSADREQRGKRIKSQPDPSLCWEGGAHHICVKLDRLMFRALLWNQQQLKCHQLPRHTVPKLQPLSSPRILFLRPRRGAHFILFCPWGWGELNSFPTTTVLHFPTGPSVPAFSDLYWAVHFFQPFLCCPTSSHLRDTGEAALGSAAPPLGCHACGGARLPAPVGILGKEQLLQQSQQCRVPVVHRVSGCANWAALQLTAVTPEDSAATAEKCHQSAGKADGHTAAMEQGSSGSSGSHSPDTPAQLGQNCNPRALTDTKYHLWTVRLLLAFEKCKLLHSWCMPYRKTLWELREKDGCIPAETLNGNPQSIKKRKLGYNPSIVWKPLLPAFTMSAVIRLQKCFFASVNRQPMHHLWPSASLLFLDSLIQKVIQKKGN